MKSVNELNKLSLPATIIIARIILGGFYYAAQSNKQNSIEEQQRLEQMSKFNRQTEENKRQDLLLKQKECESLSEGVMDTWGNIIGVTYDAEIWKECVVTYKDTETGNTETSLLRFMGDAE